MITPNKNYTEEEILIAARSFGKTPFFMKKQFILNNMTKEEKVAILIDWIKNLDEPSLDLLIIEYSIEYEGGDLENFLDNE